MLEIYIEVQVRKFKNCKFKDPKVRLGIGTAKLSEEAKFSAVQKKLLSRAEVRVLGFLLLKISYL